MSGKQLADEAKRQVFYLAGAIEHAPDGGLGWRARVEAFLEGLPGCEAYNPATDETKPLTDEEREHFRDWRTTDFARFQRTMRKIIHWDLEHLASADGVICFWDPACRSGGGTPGELTLARHRGIPVYMVTSLPLTEISCWVLGCCDRVFNSFGELETFLSK
ncbi:MAG: hypothetical protein KA419_08755 [Acidobacteria bacterium]|nr:hypothetical protein [Acidobacteriota bacterium]